MARGVKSRGRARFESRLSVVKNKADSKNHKAIFSLIFVLMSLILIVNGFRTEASQELSDISIEVVQEGAYLRATASKANKVLSWQTVRLESDSCDVDTFEGQSNYGQEPIFKLTASDDGYYYCFQIEDLDGIHAYQGSEQINLSDLRQSPEIVIEQFENILLAETSEDEAYKYAWRAVRVENSECSGQAFESVPAGEVIEDNAVILKTEDVSQQYCFEAEDEIGFKDYRISAPVNAFEAVETSEAQSLEIFAVKQFDDILIVQANKSAHWFAVSVASDGDCSEQLFGFGSKIRRASKIAYVRLFTDNNGRYYCFQAYDIALEDSSPVHVLSEQINDVDNQRPTAGYNAVSQGDYPFEVPESYPTEADLKDFLRPFLSEDGDDILNNLEIRITSEVDCPAGISGCYWVNLGHYSDENQNNILIKASGLNYYEGLDFYDRAEINHQLIKVFIREFMHAVDLGNGDPETDMRLKYRANSCWATVLEEANADENEDSSLSSISQLERTDSALKQYLDCLDRSEPLFEALRVAYEELPVGVLLEPGPWLNQDLKTVESQIWGDRAESSQRDEPQWYAELYARLIFVEQLPEELEEQYGLYFSDRQAIVDIFTFGQK